MNTGCASRCGMKAPVTESDKRLHLDSGSRPPQCPHRLWGDSWRLRRLCSHVNQLSGGSGLIAPNPYRPSLLLSCLPCHWGTATHTCRTQNICVSMKMSQIVSGTGRTYLKKSFSVHIYSCVGCFCQDRSIEGGRLMRLMLLPMG